MIQTLHKEWQRILSSEFDKEYFKELEHFVAEEYGAHTCYPEMKNIWNAFNHCSLEDVRVVIIGQDPYPGKDQANGLCFSVKEGNKHPPSLANIFKEISKDVGIDYPESGNLERWAKQGILLLNATLTVREGKPGSHQKKGWEIFTNQVITKISTTKEHVVFLLWGGFAKKKSSLINENKHTVLTSGHPSPLSANRGFWFGNQHFSSCNTSLSLKKQKIITWK